MIKTPSPNFNERAAGLSPQYIVLHYTGMESAQEALTKLCAPENDGSAHYMIDEQGEIFSLVEEDKRAWHAGVSFWKGAKDVNSLSIGIELVNKGHSFGYTPFPDAQIESLKNLLRDLFEEYHLSSDCLLGHSDVAPLRKKDPGELFPWAELAQEGFGLWPRAEEQDYKEITPEKARELLKIIGYGVHSEEEYEAALIAFQRHYVPEELEKGLTLKTAASLKALARQIAD